MITTSGTTILVGADLRRHRQPADDGDPRQPRSPPRRGEVLYNVNMAAALLTAIPPLVIYFVARQVLRPGHHRRRDQGLIGPPCHKSASNTSSSTYGQLPVLEDLEPRRSMTASSWCCSGPSGCGKTTLLNLLAGLLEVSAGRIMIGDARRHRPRPQGSRAGDGVPVLRALSDQDGARESEVRAGGQQARPRRDRAPHRLGGQAPADRAAARPQAGAALRRPAPARRHRPGAGQEGRGVPVRRAAVSNLDAKLRTEMRLEIKKLHDELKQTIVYVTHDQIEAMTMATRIAVMDGGVIQQFGTPDEIYERPANLFVAGFIGSPAMNLAPGKLSVGLRQDRGGVRRPASGSTSPTMPLRRRPAMAPRWSRACGPSISTIGAVMAPPAACFDAAGALHRKDRPRRHRLSQIRDELLAAAGRPRRRGPAQAGPGGVRGGSARGRSMSSTPRPGSECNRASQRERE